MKKNRDVRARIITIGDEILIGQIVDTNSAFIASLLESNGIRIDSILSVSDTKNAIKNALEESINKFDITIVTGGLGPTKDDITKEVLCSIFDCKLGLHEESFKAIKEFIEKRNIAFNELNQSQAYLPTAAKVIPNKNGTAPGLLFEKDGRIMINLPGVPFEMKHLMTNYVVDIIKSKFSLQHIIHKTAITYGIAESILAEKIADWEDNLPEIVKLAYLPSPKGVRLRLTYRSFSENSSSVIDDEFTKLEKILGDNLIGYGDDTSLEKRIAEYLTNKNLTFSIAESCTGGKLSSLFTAMDGASSYFNGSVVSYSNNAKADILGVDNDVLENFGAVSEECAIVMALGAKKKFNSDYAISTTGIAGPTGGNDDKPVGTVWVAVASSQGVISKRFNFGMIRQTNIERFCAAALTTFIDVLLK